MKNLKPIGNVAAGLLIEALSNLAEETKNLVC